MAPACAEAPARQGKRSYIQNSCFGSNAPADAGGTRGTVLYKILEKVPDVATACGCAALYSSEKLARARLQPPGEASSGCGTVARRYAAGYYKIEPCKKIEGIAGRRTLHRARSPHSRTIRMSFSLRRTSAPQSSITFFRKRKKFQIRRLRRFSRKRYRRGKRERGTARLWIMARI